MAITREKKEELVALYKEKIDQASALVFTNYRGVTVPQIQSLRTKLNETGTSYMVVKNTLLSIALQESGHPAPEEMLTGPNAIAFLGEDIGQGVTALEDWIKAEGDKLEIVGAIMDESVLDSDRASALADLPTKEQTLSMVLGAISAPASSLVRLVNAPSSSLARVINAHAEAQKEDEAA